MLASKLKARLTAIDNKLESKSRSEIDVFHNEARYDGSKFRSPSLQTVSSVWLKLIQDKEKEFLTEIKVTLDATARIDEEQLQRITNVCGGFFKEERYIGRLELFAQSMTRKAASYGVPFSREACRFDIANALYLAGIKNSLRTARQSIAAELQLYISKRRQKMGFSSLMTDKVTILKKDGTRFEDVKASVQTRKIFIEDSKLLIESGDLIHRKMSNGGEETFEVIDPGFHESFGGIPAGYQMSVRKLGIPEATRAVQNITYNVAGHNARINHNSIDNSTNVVNINPEIAECIAALRKTVQESELSAHDKKSAGEIIDVMDAQFQSGKPAKPVIAALLAGLPHIANIATIAASLLAFL